MLATFALRLACGLCAALLVLPRDHVNPRFYRVQFLTVLGLLVIPLVFPPAGMPVLWWVAVALGMVLAFAGSFVWSLERAPGGRSLILGTTLCLAIGVMDLPVASADAFCLGATTENLTSAALLGSATTAMLVGHSYLVMPTMSLTPLNRMLAAFLVATLVRLAVAGGDLWSWSHVSPRLPLEVDHYVWLGLRWGVGFVGPLGLGWLAWQTAKIRSTQSATGILYVVVILVFLGELANQVLLASLPGPLTERAVVRRAHSILVSRL